MTAGGRSSRSVDPQHQRDTERGDDRGSQRHRDRTCVGERDHDPGDDERRVRRRERRAHRAHDASHQQPRHHPPSRGVSEQVGQRQAADDHDARVPGDEPAHHGLVDPQVEPDRLEQPDRQSFQRDEHERAEGEPSQGDDRPAIARLSICRQTAAAAYPARWTQSWCLLGSVGLRAARCRPSSRSANRERSRERSRPSPRKP